MRLFFAILFAGFLAACSPADAGKAIGESQQAVSAFHEDLNAGRFDDIYYASNKALKDSVDVWGFEKFLRAVQQKLGKAGKSTQQGWHVNYGAGHSVVTLTMETAFEKDKAIETFVFIKSGGVVQLAGYNIQSQALVVN